MGFSFAALPQRLTPINPGPVADVHIAVPGVGALNLDRTSVGLTYGAGFDYQLGRDLYLNLDVKKLRLGADVTLGGTKVSKVNVDPVLYGIGIGWRFQP